MKSGLQRVALALVLTCFLSANTAFAIRVGAGVTVDPPPGFVVEPPNPERPDTVLAIFSRRGAGSIVLRGMVWELERGPLSEEARQALREGDPLRFSDQIVRFHVLGHSVEGLRGEGMYQGHPTVRYSIPIPVRGGAAIVYALGKAEEDAMLRSSMEAMLRSFRAPTNWVDVPPLRRAVEYLLGGFGVFALFTPIYALVAAFYFPLHPGRWYRQRGVAMILQGLGWSALAFWMLFFTEGGHIAAGLLAFAGLMLLIHGTGVFRGEEEAVQNAKKNESKTEKPAETPA